MTNQRFERAVIDVAKSILAQKISFLGGVRDMVALQASMPPDQKQYLDLFRAIDSQTDHLILDNARNQLGADRKRANEEEAKDYERLFRAEVDDLCRKIIRN